jgi:hypothetical protein
LSWGISYKSTHCWNLFHQVLGWTLESPVNFSSWIEELILKGALICELHASWCDKLLVTYKGWLVWLWFCTL